jgi:hypothetical protein
MLSKSLISSCWKLGNGIKGISVKRKIEAGSRAIRRLNAIDEALVTRAPLLNPFTTKVMTLFRLAPSNPGRIILLNFSLPLKLAAIFIDQSGIALRLISRLLI